MGICGWLCLNMKQYDYVIAGGGVSGLLLANALVEDGYFSNHRILIIDKQLKNPVKRTWCFWEKDINTFENLVSHRWERIGIGNQNGYLLNSIEPYSYKMLRSDRLFPFLTDKLTAASQIEFADEEVIAIQEQGQRVVITTAKNTYSAGKVFNSTFSLQELETVKKPVLLQHFTGWFIKTAHRAFDSKEATLMDFSVAKNGEARFMYVLPVSETEALVEYTLFSKAVLPQQNYENALRLYLEQTGITEYTVTETEFGCIPMTAHNFFEKNTDHILHIGTAGGFTRPGSGYTFKSIEEKIPVIIAALKTEQPLNTLFKPDRFLKYDAILLEVLAAESHRGAEVFQTLFEKNNTLQVLKFLDGKTTIAEEIGIINTLPKWPFIKALLRTLS